MRQVASTLELPSGGRLALTGMPDGPSLVFFHGVGGGAWSWRPQTAAFAADFACWVWEARGHGGARRVSDAGLGDYFVDAREALAAVRLRSDAPVVLIGHSMGGLLALALAAGAPADVRGLVLVDPVYPAADGASAHDMGPLRPVILAAMRPLAASFMRDGRVARTLARWLFARSFTDRARMEDAWRDQRTQIPIEYPKMLFEAFGRPEGFPVEPFAERVTVPVLAFNPRSRELSATLTRRLGPSYVCVRIAGGHYLQLDRPAEINERLRRFLSERVPT